MIKLGFVSAILADQTFEKVISFAGQMGYSCVEIMCWPVGKAERRYAGITHIDVANLTKTRIKEIRDLLEQKGVGISGLGYYPNPLEADKKNAGNYIAHIKKVIDAAPKLGLKNVNTFIGRDHRGSIEDNFKQFKKAIQDKIDKDVKDKGISEFTSDEGEQGFAIDIDKVDELDDDRLKSLSLDLATIGETLFTQKNFQMALIGENSVLSDARDCAQTLFSGFKDGDNDGFKAPAVTRGDGRIREGWSTSSAVSFVALAFETVRMEHEDAAALSIISKILRMVNKFKCQLSS